MSRRKADRSKGIIVRSRKRIKAANRLTNEVGVQRAEAAKDAQNRTMQALDNLAGLNEDQVADAIRSALANPDHRKG